MEQKTKALSIILITACLAAWTLVDRSYEPLLTLLATVIHEVGHLLAAKLCRVPLRGFRFAPFETRMVLSGTLSYGKELCICIGGPFFNLLSTALALLLDGAVFGDDPLSFFATVSLALALLNLLPIGTLDGGRILYGLLAWSGVLSAAEITVKILSFFSLFCLWSLSVYALLRAGGSLSLFLFSATLFLRLFIEEGPRRIGRI